MMGILHEKRRAQAGPVCSANARGVVGRPGGAEESAWGRRDVERPIGRLSTAAARYGVIPLRLAPDPHSRRRLEELQRNLVLSHSAGLGEPLDPRIVRLMMVLKAIGLARGHSGVRRLLVERLLALVEADALPVVPSQGSVGASGDLAPLAHMSAALIGEGTISLAGEPLPATEVLKRLDLAPLTLGPKRGWSDNGTGSRDRSSCHASGCRRRLLAARCRRALKGTTRRSIRASNRPADSGPDRGRGRAQGMQRGRDQALARNANGSRIHTDSAATR